MRYQAKALKSWLLMKRNNQRTQKKAEMKEAMKPTPNTPKSSALNRLRTFQNS